MASSPTGGGSNRIVTHLIVKDVGRFVAGMTAGKKAVHELGDEADKTDRKMRKMGKGLDSDSFKKGAKNIRGLGASLTFSEKKLTTFAITTAAYLSPAIVALGNSAAAAAMGGGLVAGGGLASLAVGLGGIGVIAVQAGKHISKVTTAMDAADLAVLQYGANSDEAARAATHLSAVIDQQGGPIIYKVIRSYRALNKEWTKLTKTAQGDLFQTFASGLRGARRLLPTFAATTNQASGAVAANAATMAKNLSGNEIRRTITSLGNVFVSMTGPLAHAAVDLVITVARWLRAAAPYAIEFSEAFADWAHNLRRSSRDSRSVRRTVRDLVSNFKAWWGLAVAVGGVVATLFGASKDEGRDFVLVLTDLVNRLNDWLQFREASGDVSRFFATWIAGIESLGNWLGLLFTDQNKAAAEAGDFFANLASHAFTSFLSAWWQMDWSGKLFTGLYLLSKLGIFNALGSAAAQRFVGAFGRSEAAGKAGEAAGMTLGKRLALGIVAGLLLVDPISEYIKQKFPSLAQYSGKKGWAELGRDIMHDIMRVGQGAKTTGGGPGAAAITKAAQGNEPLGHYTGPVRAKAGGGMIPMGAFAMVGERGPEWALATSAGVGVMPIRSQLHSEPSGAELGRDLSSSDHDRGRVIQLVVDRRVLAEVVDRARDDRKARRGEDT